MRSGLVSLILTLGTFLILTTVAVGAAKADEAYVCDGGRVVYVKFGDLERMKRTDACVAQHYGLKVEASAAEQAAAPASGATVEAQRRSPAPRASAVKALTLVTVADDERRPADPAAARPARTTPRAPAAHASTDYRNVVVINAADDKSRIYRHAR